jgi:hypothetical protein
MKNWRCGKLVIRPAPTLRAVGLYKTRSLSAFGATKPHRRPPNPGLGEGAGRTEDELCGMDGISVLGQNFRTSSPRPKMELRATRNEIQIGTQSPPLVFAGLF